MQMVKNVTDLPKKNNVFTPESYSRKKFISNESLMKIKIIMKKRNVGSSSG